MSRSAQPPAPPLAVVPDPPPPPAPQISTTTTFAEVGIEYVVEEVKVWESMSVMNREAESALAAVTTPVAMPGFG